MPYTERFSEVHQVLAHEPADSQAVEVNSGFLSLANFHRAVVIISLGDMAAGGQFVVNVDQATNTAGASSKALTGKSTTRLTQAGGDGDDLLIIEIKSIELDVANGFDCINVRINPVDAAAEFALLVLGCIPRFPPVATTLVTEIVD